MTRSYPRLARSIASESPIPLDAPVTSANLFDMTITSRRVTYCIPVMQVRRNSDGLRAKEQEALEDFQRTQMLKIAMCI